MKKNLLVLVLSVFFVSSSAFCGTKEGRNSLSQTITEAKSLIARVTPQHTSQFACEIISSEKGNDVFEIESVGSKVVLRGNNGVSLASAYNWYLKYTAMCDFSECGNQLKLPKKLPVIAQKTRIVATVPYRFMFNYCTFGYTMPWWNWERWERELDWMAMNGINLPFILTGQEAVWINTFTQYGYTSQEIRQWLGSPAHFPWVFMQNMENFGGELPESWVSQHIVLAQKIINRAHSLGMKTVLQSYFGMLPSNFGEKYPQARILTQGKWAGGLKRPDMLDPTDALFAKIAATFLKEQEKLFGRAGFYTADPFHEGGKSTGVDMRDCGRRTFDAMKVQDPDAIWVKMCWQTDNATLLTDIPADRVIALDLWAENTPFWPKGAFNGKSWIWCLLNNFGGNTELSSQLSHLAGVFPNTMANPEKGKLVGLALAPEGHCNSPAVYALFPEFTWRKDSVDLKTWIPEYLHRRYGTSSVKAELAWDGILSTVYNIPYNSVRETPANSMLEARPLRGEKARTWSNTRPSHNTAKLAEAWLNQLDAAPDCEASDAYRYDLADFTRQVLGDLARPVYERIQKAIEKKDLIEFQKTTALYLDLMGDMDAVLSTRKEFLLGAWIRDARAWGQTPENKDLYELQARLIVTTWDDNPGSDLNDYGCRQWNGLLKDYYRTRWDMYFKAVGTSLKSGAVFDPKPFLADLGKFEKGWVRAHNHYSSIPVGNTVEFARKIARKYILVFKDYYPSIPKLK